MDLIIDTNVPQATRGENQISEACQIKLLNIVNRVLDGKVNIYVDNQFHILGEYLNHFWKKDQLADKFFELVLQAMTHNVRNVYTVNINMVDPNGHDFDELPDSFVEVGFDASDRKFIAVFKAVNKNYGIEPVICQGTDFRWFDWLGSLQNEGIKVCFPCDEDYYKPCEEALER